MPKWRREAQVQQDADRAAAPGCPRRRALGDIDGAARDFNKAWHIADEEGIQDRALAGLDAIQRPLEEDEPEEEPPE